VGRKFPKQTIRDVDLRGKTILLRADYNVPLTKRGQISDDLRIRASLPTLRYLLEQNCKVIIMSHLGRPKGRDPKLSLKVVADHLSKLLGRQVKLLGDYLQTRKQLIGLVLIMDVRHPMKPLDIQMLDFFALTGRPVHILLSKADQLSKNEQIKTRNKRANSYLD